MATKKIKKNKIRHYFTVANTNSGFQGGSSGVKVKRHRLTSTTAAEMGVSERVDDVSGGGLAALWEGGRAGGRRSWRRRDFALREGSLIIPTCARLQRGGPR